MQEPKRWPWGLRVLTATILVAAGAATTWALLTVMRPAENPLDKTKFTSVAVREGKVGASVSLNTVAAWHPALVGTNQATGIVTGLEVNPGSTVDQGSTLYSVGLHEVVVAQGDVPAFREIALGVVGTDVAQLQRMLAALGFYGGGTDGIAGAGTVGAIKEWQKSMRVDPTGVVGVGDVIYVPTLPARVSLDSEIIVRGATLAGGENVLRAYPQEPAFRLPVNETQATTISTGTRVEIESPSGSVWQGVTGEMVSDPESNTLNIEVLGPDGASVCGVECSLVETVGESRLTSRVILTEDAEGLVVPSAALTTGADGKVAVITTDGDRVDVSVTTSAKGMSIVHGVSEGTRVRLPAQESAE